MNTHLKSYCLLGGLLLGVGSGELQAQVTTVTCGAVSTNAGAKLLFASAASVSTNSGYVHPIVYQRVANRFGTNNYYSTTNLLFQALSVKTNSSTSAGLGAYLVCEIAAVSGPVGGVLSFWEQGAGWPTYNFAVGGIYASNKNSFILSNLENGAGRPDGDPFGNIRGRRFTVNKPGDYLVTFMLRDVSKNHPTLLNTPIHVASDPLTIKFSTKVDIGITSIAKTNDVITLVYRQGALTNVFVEASTNLTSGFWSPVVGPFTSAPALTTNRFTNNPAIQTTFYRLRGVAP